MPDHPGGGSTEAGKKLLIVLDRLGKSIEHLALSVDDMILLFEKLAASGHDPVNLAQNAMGLLGKIFGTKGERPRR
jgi:hypothetical protein